MRAPLGDKFVAGGRFGKDLVATVVVDKYDDGLPLHRQKRRLGRLGLDISVSTLADQVTWATDLLRPLWRAAIQRSRRKGDASGRRVCRCSIAMPPNGKRLGTLWGYVGDQSIAAYVYTSTEEERTTATQDRPRRDARIA